MLTYELLHHQVSYNPETWLFHWINPTCTHMSRGDRAGCIRPGKGYVWFKIGRKSYSAHRLAFLYMTGEWPAAEVDHINGDRSDNRWANLRHATRGQNMCNKALYKNSTSKVRGVTFHKRIKRWQVRIGIDGNRIHLGYYNTIEEATAVREKVEPLIHGKFSALLSRDGNDNSTRAEIIGYLSQKDLFASDSAISHANSGSIIKPTE